MGYKCIAAGCNNIASKDKEFSYHKLPKKKPTLLKKWLHNLKVTKLPKSSPVVCSSHFEARCFPRDFMAELLPGMKSRNQLSEDAVPTLFSYSEGIRKRQFNERVAEIKKKHNSELTKESLVPVGSNATVEVTKEERKSFQNENLTQMKMSLVPDLSNATVEETKEERKSFQNENLTQTASQHPCHICGKKFDYGFSLIRHMQSHTKKRSREKSHKCSICGKKYQKEDCFEKHLKSHIGEKRYRCEICDEDFLSKSVLLEHKTTHVKKPFKCKTCGSCFAQFSSLRVHFCHYPGQITYICEVCGGYFSQKSQLLDHMRSHGTPCTCKICGKMFQSVMYLKMHMKNHTSGKPISERSMLHIINVQTGEITYKCDICKRCFSSDPALLSHKCVGSDEMTLNCEVCGAFFTNEYLFNEHKKQHGDEKLSKNYDESEEEIDTKETIEKEFIFVENELPVITKTEIKQEPEYS